MNARSILVAPSPLLWTVLVAGAVCGWIAYARNWQTALILFIVTVGIVATRDIRARRQPRSIVRRRGASSVRPVVSPHNSEHAPRRHASADNVDPYFMGTFVFDDDGSVEFIDPRAPRFEYDLGDGHTITVDSKGAASIEQENENTRRATEEGLKPVFGAVDPQPRKSE